MASNVELACSAEVERFLAEETAAFTGNIRHDPAFHSPSPSEQPGLLRPGTADRKTGCSAGGAGLTIAPWFDRSWLMHAKFKPKGYPRLTILTRSTTVPKSPGIGGYLDPYFLNTQLKGRTGLVVGGPEFSSANSGGAAAKSRLNVACGRAASIRRISNFRRPPRITCLDSDEECWSSPPEPARGTRDAGCVPAGTTPSA